MFFFVAASVAAQVGDVFHAGGDTGDAFVIQRAPLPAIGNGVGVRTNFVGTQALEVLALAEEHAHVRPEKFVSRAHQKIAIERGHVDEAVRGIVDGVDVGEGSGGVGEADDFFYGIDGADGVGGVSGGDQLGVGIYFRGEVGQVEGAVFLVDLGPADRHSPIFCHLQPRGN